MMLYLTEIPMTPAMTLSEFFSRIYSAIPYDIWLVIYIIAIFAVFRFMVNSVKHGG